MATQLDEQDQAEIRVHPLLKNMKIKQSTIYLGAKISRVGINTWEHIKHRIVKTRSIIKEMQARGFHVNNIGRKQTAKSTK